MVSKANVKAKDKENLSLCGEVADNLASWEAQKARPTLLRPQAGSRLGAGANLTAG